MAKISIRLTLGTLFLIVGGIIVLAAYEVSFPLLLVRLNLWPILVLLTVLLAAFGVGQPVVEGLARIGARGVPRGQLVERNLVRISFFPAAEEILLSLGVGLGMAAYGVMSFNLLHLLRLRWVAPVFLLLVLFGVARGARLWKRTALAATPYRGRRGQRQRWKLAPLFRLVVLVCIFTPLVLGFFLALTPVHQSDAIRYHMAVPALYVHAGGYIDLPSSAFSDFPFTIEMLYTLSLLFGAESASKLIHWTFLVLLVGGVYCLGRHVRMRNLGLLAAVVLVNAPFLPVFGSWAFIEVGLTFYQFMVVYCLIRLLRCLSGSEQWGEKEWPPDPSKRLRFVLHPSRWVVLCGVFSGFALGTKYTSFFLFVIAAATLVVIVLKDRLRRKPEKDTPKSSKKPDRWRPLPNPGRQIATLIAIAALIASPWYVKSLARLGNPVYPFAGSIFPTPHWSEYNAEFYRYHAGLKGELNQFREKDWIGKLWDLITLPYTLTVNRRLENDLAYFASCDLKRLWPWNRDEDGVPGGIFPYLDSGNPNLRHSVSYTGDPNRRRSIYFGDWDVGPLWLLLLPLLLTAKRPPWEVRVLLFYGALLFLFWAFTYRDNRFLIPTFAVLAVPVGYVLLAYSQRTWTVFAPFRAFFIIILLWNLLSLLRSVSMDFNPFPIITGRQTISGFLEEQRDTGSFIRAMRKGNEIRSPGEKILLVGEHRAYHCRPPYVCADWFNTPVLIQWIRESGSFDATVERLHAEQVDYALIHQGEIDKYWEYYLPHFLPVDEACAWLDVYRRASNKNDRQALLGALVESVYNSPAWKIYNQLLQSEELLEPVYEEHYDEGEKEQRPPLPARSKIGVYRLR